MSKLKELIYFLKYRKTQLAIGLFLILITLPSFVKADDSIYIKSNNIVQKNNDFKLILTNNITSDLMIDSNNIYFYTNSNFYIVNKSDGNINYKIFISGIKEQKQTNNFTYLKTDYQIYKINKSSGIIEQKQVFNSIIEKLNSFFGVSTLNSEIQTINYNYYNDTNFTNHSIFVNQTFTNKTDFQNQNNYINQSKINYSDVRFKVGSFSRDISTASGTQTISGLPFKPAFIQFIISRDSSAPNSVWSIGYDDGITATSLVSYAFSAADSVYNYQTGVSIIAYPSSGNIAQGYVQSMNSDGFTIYWQKIGSPTGIYYIIYTAFR